jgi:hypothetical protein
VRGEIKERREGREEQGKGMEPRRGDGKKNYLLQDKYLDATAKFSIRKKTSLSPFPLPLPLPLPLPPLSSAEASLPSLLKMARRITKSEFPNPLILKTTWGGSIMNKNYTCTPTPRFKIKENSVHPL